jgi:hypothetical protein
MSDVDMVQLLKDVVEHLYFRAAACKFGCRDEYMAIKGVQHALEDALMKQGIETTFRKPRDGHDSE